MVPDKKITLEISLIIALTLLLLPIIFFYAVPALKKNPKPALAPAQSAFRLQTQKQNEPALKASKAVNRYIVYNEIPLESAARDPFKPSGTVAKSDNAYNIGSLVLSGISIVGSNKFAIINDTVYRVGDIINGAVIHQIEHDHVILIKGNDNYTLRLKGD